MFTAEELAKHLTYCPETGVLRWIKKTGRRAAGHVAGYVSPMHGYLIVGFRRNNYLAHRLAFLLMTGRWPEGDVDHANGDRLDNRWSNLRECTRYENMQNMVARQKNVGQFRAHNGRYRARIKAFGRIHELGYFATPEEASAAYVEAKSRLHTFNPVLRRVP